MKQITKSADIVQKLIAQGVDPDSVTVFEATALNTQPIRKKHPIYNKGVHTLSFLNQMAAQLNTESLPLQLMHDTSVTPVGRVFYGEVVGEELRVLFFVDNSEEDLIAKVNSGTIDQVSVSVLPKQVLCSTCGFDFFGPEASFDNLYLATCANDHTLGQDAHAVMGALNSWFEMSLVGRGGATGAKIQPRDQSAFASDSSRRLAATGFDINHLVLNATAEKAIMDLTQIIADLTDAKAKIIGFDAEKAALTTKLEASLADVEALRTELTDVKAKLEADNSAAELEKTKTDLSAAHEALSEVAKKILVASGDVEADVADKSIEDLIGIISEKSEKLSALIVAGGKAKGAADDDAKPAPAMFSGISAFRPRSR